MGESSVELAGQMSFLSQQTIQDRWRWDKCRNPFVLIPLYFANADTSTKVLKTLYFFIGATPFRVPLARPTWGRLHGKTGGKQRTE
jgi:hypothetical protein